MNASWNEKEKINRGRKREREREREREKRRNMIRFCRKISEGGGVRLQKEISTCVLPIPKTAAAVNRLKEGTHQPTLRLLLLLLPLLLLTVLPLPLPRPVEHKVGHILVDDKGNRTGGCDAQQVGHDALVEAWNALIAEEGRGEKGKNRGKEEKKRK